MSGDRGALRLVGTPIGNLDDFSPRGQQTLAEADLIACEDSRRTGLLLQRMGIGRRPLLVVNEHTEAARTPEIIERIASGEVVALISDAGMPAVSDPGGRLVAAVLDAGLAVDVVPGPTAVTTALVLSGLPTDRYVFEGFLPRKGAVRRRRLSEIAAEQRTVVVYESPRRVATTLADLASACGGERPAAVARELTKLHQTVERGPLAALAARLAGGVRGEVVVVIGPDDADPAETSADAIRDQLLEALAAGASRRDAVAAVMARGPGVSKRAVYDLAIEIDTGAAATGPDVSESA